MVYSRATTSEMAERDFLPELLVCLGVVEGLSLAIAAVVRDGYGGLRETWLSMSIKPAILVFAIILELELCARDSKL